MSKRNHSLIHRGFTLVEIIIALALAGVLAAVAIPFYRDYMIRAEVVGAFEFAESMRTKVMVDDNDGLINGSGIFYQASGTEDTVQLLYWTRGEPGLKGRMTAALYLPRISDAFLPGFELEWRESGDWHCISAIKHTKPGKQILEEKYLPGICREGSGPLPSKCPAGQESVMLSTGPACTATCPAGTVRDKTNPTLCQAAAQAAAPATTVATPAAAAVPATTPVAPAVPAAAAAPAAKPTPATPPPPTQPVASIKCRTCTAGLEDLCERIHEEITCTAPNNYCITFVDNQDDGSKIVNRGCGNFQRVHDEWYEGTSDDDKCRERINVQQKLAFTCTFACTTDNCNDNLRPAEDTLYQPN